MSHSQLTHLISMVNQIADNQYSADDAERTVTHICEHLQRFWARSMKLQIIEYATDDGRELRPLALLAVQRLAGA